MDRSTVPRAATALSTLPQPDNRSGCTRRTAVGYVRVSTSMQADDGLSLDTQRVAIVAYCRSHDLQLIRICQDVVSGAKSERAGLRDALATKREATGERTREAISHINRMGYFFGKVPYGKARRAGPGQPTISGSHFRRRRTEGAGAGQDSD